MILKNVKFSIQNNNILDNISFSLNSEDKIGLVGVNGSGKSTLLKLISGNLNPDSGKVNLENESVGYLNQEIPHTYDDYTILSYIKKKIGIDEIESKLHELENNLTENNMDEYSEFFEKYIALDGYNFEANLNTIIMGLELSKNLNDKIKTLSGGEKIKVLLAELLLQNSDILLLDEPTNNLDIGALRWLEKYLENEKKKMIIVSHDEVFLNNITNKIFELNNGTLKEYNMKYDDYLLEKKREYDSELLEHNKAVEEKEKLKKQIQKSKQWANKGNNKKAKDNDKLANNYAKERTNTRNISKYTKALENLNIPKFEEKKPINFFFDFDDEKGNKNIYIENLVCGYENFSTPVLNLTINFGQKIQINGGNGSGKTTLLKTLLGELKPLSGNIVIGNDVKIGYISQDTLFANTKETILEYLTKNKTNIDLSYIFTLLNKFNIDYENKDKLYSSLSPGERTRLNLVKIAIDKTNVLLLDEVTNHLDKEAIDLIYELISSYQGTIISVSHNRKYIEILNPDINLDIKTGEIYYNNITKKR